jgi:large-conductance mechanosensitive channel
MSKGRIILTFILLGFAIYFGIAMVNSFVYEIPEAQRAEEQAHKDLQQANRDVEIAEQNLHDALMQQQRQ